MLSSQLKPTTMNTLKKQNHTKVALFAGATALMALAPNIHAQSSVDALINKLEQKGELTVNEAQDLKADNATNSIADLNAAMNSRFPMPDWVTSYKLSGDFRGRFDDMTTESSSLADRIRLRYRLRVGLLVNMKDDLQVGFRVGSGEPASGTGFGGNPLSNNSTLQDNGTKKFLYIDAAYGKWTAINNDTWMMSGTFGKMDQPFVASPMLFDADYTPEGAALQSSYKINNRNSLAFNTAAFVLDEVKTSSRDPFLYGAQLIWNSTWSSKLDTSLGFGIFDIVNKENLAATSASSNSGVPYINQGNTRVGASGSLTNNYNPIVLSGSATYKLDSFPLYTGAFPIKFAGEFMDNAGAEKNNEGYWAGITLGKSGKKGLWDISYRYQYLEADAWYDQVVDDDNIAYYTAAPNAGSSGIFGGTNVKGHLIKANYSITDALTLTFTCYMNNLIHPVPGGSSSDAMHVMADVMWKF
jgi:hypothetical protein